MWKKIIFVVFVLIFGAFAALATYLSNLYSYLEDNANSGNYTEVARFYIPFFDSKSVIEENDDDQLVVAIYPSVMELSYKNDDDESVSYLDKGYNIFIFNYSNINFSNIQTTTNTVTNESSFVFSNGELTFSYPLVSLDTENAYDIVGTTVYAQYYLKSNDLNTNLNGLATNFKVLNSEGTEVYSKAVNLDLSDAFFTDVSSFVSTYNNYSENGAMTNDEFSEYYENFKLGYTYDQISSDLPSSIIWQVVGTMALYLVLCAILWVILFYRHIFGFNRNRNKAYEYVPKNKGNSKDNVIDAKVTDIDNIKEDKNK